MRPISFSGKIYRKKIPGQGVVFELAQGDFWEVEIVSELKTGIKAIGEGPTMRMATAHAMESFTLALEQR